MHVHDLVIYNIMNANIPTLLCTYIIPSMGRLFLIPYTFMYKVTLKYLLSKNVCKNILSIFLFNRVERICRIWKTVALIVVERSITSVNEFKTFI